MRLTERGTAPAKAGTYSVDVFIAWFNLEGACRPLRLHLTKAFKDQFALFGTDDLQFFNGLNVRLASGNVLEIYIKNNRRSGMPESVQCWRVQGGRRERYIYCEHLVN